MPKSKEQKQIEAVKRKREHFLTHLFPTWQANLPSIDDPMPITRIDEIQIVISDTVRLIRGAAEAGIPLPIPTTSVLLFLQLVCNGNTLAEMRLDTLTEVDRMGLTLRSHQVFKPSPVPTEEGYLQYRVNLTQLAGIFKDLINQGYGH